MRPLLLAAALTLAALPATGQTIPMIPGPGPGDLPAPGTFCGLFTLCPPAPPVACDTGG